MYEVSPSVGYHGKGSGRSARQPGPLHHPALVAPTAVKNLIIIGVYIALTRFSTSDWLTAMEIKPSPGDGSW